MTSKSLPLWCVVIALLAIPLTLPKPGLPLHLRAGEAANYLIARSLIEDGDIRCELNEPARLFEEFPYTNPVSISVVTEDGDESSTFDSPLLYPILIALPMHFFGANGAIALNMVAFLLALVVQVRFLSKRALDQQTSLALVSGFFVLSVAFAYVFQLRSEALLFAGVAIALPMLMKTSGTPLWQAAIAGLMVSPAMSSIPAISIPFLAVLSWHRRWKPAVVASIAVGVGVVALTTLDQVQLPTSAVARELLIESPYHVAPLPAPEIEWFQSPLLTLVTAFVGRYTGFFPYAPLAVLFVALAFVGTRDRTRRRLLAFALLTSVATVAQWNSVATAEQAATLGNPSFVALLPFLTLLVDTVPKMALPIGWAAAVLCVGPMLSSLLGIVVPGGDVASHVRSFPFNRLPLEDHLLPHLQGYESFPHPQATVWAPTNRVKAAGDQIWVLGGTTAELWLTQKGSSLTDIVFDIRTAAANNRIRLAGFGDDQIIESGQVPIGGSSHRINRSLGAPTRVRQSTAGPVTLHRFFVTTTKGHAPLWTGTGPYRYYVGADLTFVGSQSFLDKDIFGVEWLGCGGPAEVEAGEEFRVVSRLRNTSPETWLPSGAARVRLGYRWIPGSDRGFERADLSTSLEPGATWTTWQSIRAPLKPGSHTLELEPIYESVAWFGERTDAAVCSVDIEIRPSTESSRT